MHQNASSSQRFLNPQQAAHVHIYIVSLQQENNFILLKSGGQLKWIYFVGAESTSKSEK